MIDSFAGGYGNVALDGAARTGKHGSNGMDREAVIGIPAHRCRTEHQGNRQGQKLFGPMRLAVSVFTLPRHGARITAPNYHSEKTAPAILRSADGRVDNHSGFLSPQALSKHQWRPIGRYGLTAMLIATATTARVARDMLLSPNPTGQALKARQ